MPAGRRPKPAALKLLNGRGPGKDSAGREINMGPGYVRTAPDAPDFLDDESRAEWDRVVPELQRLGLLTRVARASLVAYCENWSIYVAATREVHEFGLTREKTIERRGGDVVTEYVANPAVAIQRQAGMELRRWAIEYGLTPASEQKVKAPDADQGDDAEAIV